MPRERYFDPLPPPKDFPVAVGSLAAMEDMRRAVEYRASGSPVRDIPKTLLHRHLIIAASVLHLKLTQQEVGDVFGITQQAVSCIVKKMETLAGPLEGGE